MEFLEKFQYEGRPYFYAFLAMGSVMYAKSHGSKVIFFSGILLAIASYAVFRVRKEYRTNFMKRNSF